MSTPLLTLVIVALMGGVLGILLTALLVKDLLKVIALKAPEHPCFQHINVRCEMRDEGGHITMVNTLGANATGMTAKLVEQWLKERDLVMMPAGQDFTVKVKP